jgi:hypothetical protein
VIPTASVEQMRELDRLMIEELHVELLQMMENAGAQGVPLHQLSILDAMGVLVRDIVPVALNEYPE